MACVNPNDPRFLEILQQVGNPLLAEIEFDKLYPFEEERIADLESRMFEEPKISIKKILSENEIDEDLIVPLYKALNTGNKITAEDFPPDAYRSFKQFVNSLPINLDTKLTTNGKPTILFHGSPSKFGTFKEEFLGSYTNAPSAKQAFFAAKDISTAIHYGEKDKSALDQLGQLEGDNPEPDWEYEEYKYIMDLPEDDPKRIAYDAEQERIKKSENEAKGKYFVEEWQDNTRDERVTFYNKTNIYPLFFISKNPLIVDVKGNRKNIGSINKTLIQAKEDGYDAVVFKNIYDGGKGNTDVYTVFSSSQIVNIFDVINEQFLNEKRPIDIEEFKPIKEGVAEVFESNPELANSVYKALGFETFITPNKVVSINNTNSGDETPSNENELSFNLKDIEIEEFNDIVKGNNATVYFSVPISKTITFGERANNTIAQIMLHKNGNIVSISSVAIYSPNVRVGKNQLKVNEGKGIGKYIYELLGDKLLNEQGLILRSDASMSIGAQNVWEYLVKNNKAKKAEDGRYYYKGNQITPQQKQQAQQLYSQYLDTVFPESKVKDIVYHGTDQKLEKFSKDFIGKNENVLGVNGINVAVNKENAENYARNKNFQKISEGLHSLIINVKNPILVESGEKPFEKLYQLDRQFFNNNYNNAKNLSSKEVTEQLINKNFDSVYNKMNDWQSSYVVFEPEQIHILGNKEDIKGFQEFVVKNKQKETIDNVYVPLSEEHRQLLESARENLNPVEADRVEQMLKGETRFLDDSNFEMC